MEIKHPITQELKRFLIPQDIPLNPILLQSLVSGVLFTMTQHGGKTRIMTQSLSFRRS